MNKPVAWMYRVNNSFNTFSTIEPPDDAYDEGTLVPLYTHPVKEQEEPNWKEMYLWMHELNHKHWSELSELKAHPVKEPMMVLDGNRVYPAFKELTDEEIEEVINRTYWVGTEDEIRMKIARAILRKASE